MKKKRSLATLLIIMLALTFFNPMHVSASSKEITLEQPKLYIDKKGKVDVKNSSGKVEKKEKVVNQFIDKYRFVIAGISGVGAVSMILFFILGFIRLGSSGASSRPEERNKVIFGLAATGVAAAGLGAVAFITGLFYNSIG